MPKRAADPQLAAEAPAQLGDLFLAVPDFDRAEVHEVVVGRQAVNARVLRHR